MLAPTWLGGYSLSSTGHLNSDQFPEGRLKLIHSVGWVSKIKFDWNDAAKKYSGQFQPGNADYGICRFSSATPPTKDATGPGISVKLLRDGVASGNFVSMYDLL